MDRRELRARILQESRETSSLLFTRARFLRDHLATLMHLLCRYEAVLADLEARVGEEGRERVRSLERARREIDLDHLLHEMLQMLERSAVEAAEIEELARSDQEAGEGEWVDWEPAGWLEQLVHQLERLPEGRLTAGWDLERAPATRKVPAALPELVAGSIRCLAQRCSPPTRVRLTCMSLGDHLLIEARFHPSSEAGPIPEPGPDEWTLSTPSEPALVRMAAAFLASLGGNCEVRRGPGGRCEGNRLRFSAKIPMSLSKPIGEFPAATA